MNVFFFFIKICYGVFVGVFFCMYLNIVFLSEDANIDVWIFSGRNEYITTNEFVNVFILFGVVLFILVCCCDIDYVNFLLLLCFYFMFMYIVGFFFFVRYLRIVVFI